MLKENEKLGVLVRELSAVSERRAIVFVNTKKSCDTVSRHLDQLEYHCTVLHGGKTQVSLACWYGPELAVLSTMMRIFFRGTCATMQAICQCVYLLGTDVKGLFMKPLNSQSIRHWRR